MTDEQIKYSIVTNELKLGLWDKFTHYLFVGFLLIVPSVFLFLYLNDFIEGTSKPVHEGIIWFSLVMTFLGILFYLLQRKRLKLESVKTNLTREELGAVVERVANELDWRPSIIKKKIIVAKTHPGFFSGSWGEQITILFDRNKVFVNSICDPGKRSSVISMGRNRKNINTLIEEIEKASR